jgi:hypothetical protein
MQVDLVQNGKVISYWDNFTKDIRKKLYLLAHAQTTMIKWQHLRWDKCQNSQAYCNNLIFLNIIKFHKYFIYVN